MNKKRVTTDWLMMLTSAVLRRSCSRSGLWSLSTSATISWSACHHWTHGAWDDMQHSV